MELLLPRNQYTWPTLLPSGFRVSLRASRKAATPTCWSVLYTAGMGVTRPAFLRQRHCSGMKNFSATFYLVHLPLSSAEASVPASALLLLNQTSPAHRTSISAITVFLTHCLPKLLSSFNNAVKIIGETSSNKALETRK